MSTVMVYSDDLEVRTRIRMALGRIPTPAIGRVEYVECADGKAVVATIDAGGIDLCILDAEAWPTGGMGLARQMKDEIGDCPAMVLLIARRDDQWLAAWSRADAVLPLPVDPFQLTEAVVRLLTARAERSTVPVGKPHFGLRRA